MVDILGFMVEAVASVDCHRGLCRKGEIAGLAEHVDLDKRRRMRAQHLVVDNIGADIFRI